MSDQEELKQAETVEQEDQNDFERSADNLAEDQEIDSEADETNDDEDHDEVIVSIGDESPTLEEESQKAPDWVRELRKTQRETARENRELKERLAAVASIQQKPFELGEKPKLENFDWDADRYESALDSWYDRKRLADEQEARANVERENHQKAWQEKLNSYGKAKTELKVRDFEEAEFVAQETLNIVQQGVVLEGAENPALVIYALGKNPAKAKELANIADPVKFAFAISKLETQLKTTTRKSAPSPEKTVRGTGSISNSSNAKLEELKARAEKTGNYNDYFALKWALKK